MRLHLSLGALVLAVAVPAFAGAPPDTDACSLLTRDEAAAIVGSPVGEGKALAGNMGQGVDVSACSYEGGGKELKVNLWRFPPEQSQGLDMYRGMCKQKEQAAGLGDMACWYNAQHKELQVLKGTKLLILELRSGRGASDALITAAKQALARLK